MEYTQVLKELQDQCNPSSMEEINHLFSQDTGSSLSETFDFFDPNPIGVASLAQVHRAVYKGQEVAVKIQHPFLKKYTDLDIETTASAVSIVKYFFPDFEFGWLADEMKANLPLEMNFIHEASNANQLSRNFRSNAVLNIPFVISANERILIMEFCNGTRIDNLEYLKENRISNSEISTELSKIYYKMIFLDLYLGY